MLNVDLRSGGNALSGTCVLFSAAEKNRTWSVRWFTDCSASVFVFRRRISSSTRSAVVQREQSWSGCTSCKVRVLLLFSLCSLIASSSIPFGIKRLNILRGIWLPIPSYATRNLQADIIQYDVFSMCDIYLVPQRLELNLHYRPPRWNWRGPDWPTTWTRRSLRDPAPWSWWRKTFCRWIPPLNRPSLVRVSDDTITNVAIVASQWFKSICALMDLGRGCCLIKHAGNRREVMIKVV